MTMRCTFQVEGVPYVSHELARVLIIITDSPVFSSEIGVISYTTCSKYTLSGDKSDKKLKGTDKNYRTEGNDKNDENDGI